MKMEQCSETSAYKFQTPGNHPKESIQLSNFTHLSAEKVHPTAVIKATSLCMVRPMHVTNERKCKGICEIAMGTGRGCKKKL